MIHLLHSVKWFQLFLYKTYKFNICTQLKSFKYCDVTVTIQLNIIHLFAHTYMIKQFYLTHIRYYRTGSEWTISNGNEGVLNIAKAPGV